MNLFEHNQTSGVWLKSEREEDARPTLWSPHRVWHDAHARRWAFVGLYVFTLLLYVRPNDWVPGMGAFPLVKIVTLLAPLAYLGAIIARGERLTIWPIELKMLLVILGLGLLFLPVALSKEDAINTLSDPFLKVLLIFTLLINVITSQARLRTLMTLIVVCGGVLALGAIRSYMIGAFDRGRIVGMVGGIFQNANDLATELNILLGLTVALAFTCKKWARLFYVALGGLFVLAIILTFSRAGFLGLVALAVVLFGKLRRRHRILPVLSVLVLVGALSLAVPGGYGARLATIFNPQEDKTESAQERSVVLQQAFWVALGRPVVGVGMGNFYLYSKRDMKAHNSYLEIWAELGLLGLGAYLVFLFVPLRSLKHIENETLAKQEAQPTERYYFSVGLQAALVSYLVCSFFSSIQYQWFVYYPIAFAIALKNIHAPMPEVLTSRLWEDAKRVTGRVWERRQRGVLWAERPAVIPLQLQPQRQSAKKEMKLLKP